MRLNKFLPFLASLLIAWTAQGAAPNEHYRDALWVAESHGVLKLLAADGTLQVEIDSAQEVRSVAVDAVAGRVWVSRPKRLVAYGFDGEPQLDVALEAMRPSADRHLLSVDRRDGTVWLARGKELRVFAFEGAPVASFAADRDVEAISLAEQAGRRWLATKDRAELRDEQGAILVSLDVPRGEKLHDLAYDPAHGTLWLLTNKKLHFLDLESEQVAWALDLRHGDRIRLLEGDGAWVAGKKSLTRVSQSGGVIESFEYSQSGDLVAFVVDTMDGSLWLATQQHLGHYRPDGTVIDRLAFAGPDHAGRLWSLDMYIDDIPPSVRFALPEPGTLTNNNQLPFVLEYNDVGIGTNPATIAFTVNDTETAFSCAEQGDNSSQCAPSQALPEGESQVSATVADFNSNVSEPAEVGITVDTIPPVITLSEPEEGTEVSESQVSVVGHINEPGSVWVNSKEVVLDSDFGFSADVSLESGANTIKLEAKDLAGNTTHQELTVIYQPTTIPPDPVKVASSIDPSKTTTVYDGTRFLYEGPEAIQRNVEVGVIEPRRVAVLRGKVLDRNGDPLPGVSIRAHGHPEYGTTLTRADGTFDFVVNGGGQVTLEYQKAGYMPVQRAIETPWRDYRWFPDVVMSPYDDQVTRIELSSAEPMQTARGSMVRDANGERTAMVMFPNEISAEMVMPDGTREVLDTLDVRASEYTVGPRGPDAMPGKLPPTSAYTYAVELSVDQAIEAGAHHVEFSEPVPFYVDNFLDFPVGIDVPMGYYDREEAQWIASRDGRIVEIIDIVEGRAVLDVNGSKVPATSDELDVLQIDEAELTELAQHYQVGDSLWRVSVPHFTPWDCNWPYTFPDDAEAPADEIERPDHQEDDPSECDGSLIECQNQVLGKRIDIEGMPFTFNYRSNRVPGRRAAYKLDIPITGEAVSDSLKRVEVEISVVGRRFSRTFDPVKNQSWEFKWDGRDAYGRELYGGQYTTVKIRNVYDAVYVESNEAFEASFGSVGDTDKILGDRDRGEVAMEQRMTVPVGVWDSRIVGLGGWTLSKHHSYEQLSRELFRGDGNTRRGRNLNHKVTRYVGNKDSFYNPLNDNDDVSALDANLQTVNGIAVGPNGDLYIAAGYNDDEHVYKVDAETEFITEFAGHGLYCGSFCDEDGLATEVGVPKPQDVAVGSDGEVYIAYRYGIAKVSPDGLLKRIYFKDFDTYIDNRHQPRVARINAIAVGPTGTIYFAFAHSVQRLNSDGSVDVIAGKPRISGYAGDGGPAAEALFNEISDLAIGRDGSIYIADMRNHVIRRIAPDGTINVVAGTAELSGHAGDGGPATEALLLYPQAVQVNRKGEIYISEDFFNSYVRKIGIDGTIYTVAGVRTEVFSIYCIPELMEDDDEKYCEDDSYARNRAFETITGLAFNGDQELYIGDRWGRRVYKVETPLPDFSSDEMVVPDRDGEEIYIFDQAGKHLRTVDVSTGAIVRRYEYGPNGFLTKILDDYGNETSIQRDVEGQPLEIVGLFGQVTSLIVNADGYLESVEDPLGEEYEFSYQNGLLQTVRDRNGNLSQFDYDTDGRLVADTDPEGGGWSLSRKGTATGYEVETRSAAGWSIEHRVEREDDDSWGQVSTAPYGGSSMRLEESTGTVKSTTPDGVTIESRLAPHPLLGLGSAFVAEATMTLPDGQSLAVERSLEFSGDRKTPFGEHDVDETVTVNGREYHLNYDAATRSWSRTSPEGRTSTMQFNEQGQVVSSRLGSLAPIEREFNARGQVSQINQNTRTTSLNYDGNGYLSQVVDAEFRATTLKNDRVGRTRELHLPGDRLVTFDFDANGNVTGITPPERPTHGFAYNGVDLATRYEPPEVDGTESTVATDYRLDRTVGAVTRADGGDVGLAYEENTGLVTGIAAPQGTYSYTYLPNSDRLTSATGPAGQRLDYAWNGPLVDQVTWSGEIDGQVDYAWDDNFWLDALTVNGQTIDYQYDNDGLVTGAGSLSLDYAPDVPLLKNTNLGSVQTGWTYNEYGEPSSYKAGLEGGSTLYRTEFTRDRMGRITEKVETVGGVETTYAYEYDVAGRLIEVRENGAVVDTYLYDANGNRLSHDGTTGVYDAQDRLLSYGDYDYTYTPDGELKSKTNTATGETTRYTYDAFSNLRSVTLPDGTEIEYVIDAQNRRVGKKVDGTLVQGFLYSDKLNPVAELDDDGNIRSIFMYASRLNIPDYVIKEGRAYRIIADHLGSVRLVVDTETGELVQQMDYTSFGEVVLDTNPGFQPFGFAGGIFDNDTRLLRFGGRDYSAKVGRWLSRDSNSFYSGTLNLYNYVFSDPINWVDVNGFEAERDTGLLGALLPAHTAGFARDSEVRDAQLNISGLRTAGVSAAAAGITLEGLLAGLGGPLTRTSIGLICRAANKVGVERFLKGLEAGITVAEILSSSSGNATSDDIRGLAEAHNKQMTEITQQAEKPAKKRFIQKLVRKLSRAR